MTEEHASELHQCILRRNRTQLPITFLLGLLSLLGLADRSLAVTSLTPIISSHSIYSN